MGNYNTSREVWKDILGYEGFYQVSNHGRVRSLDRVVTSKNRSSQRLKGEIKDVSTRFDGYKFTALYKDNKEDKRYVHRLVAEAFIGNPKEFPMINHIDENPSNNHVNNLEWCDNAYNLNYGGRKEKFLNSKGFKEMIKRNRKPIYVIDSEGKRHWYDSTASACKELGLRNSNVSLCLTKKERHKTHKGYKFEYAEPID